ncbi:MAG TPA: hypothetical protein VM492_02285 [Sumerlaeia bacterium]|nr:hypothetical protein [Sumerlaeia bacterium]
MSDRIPEVSPWKGWVYLRDSEGSRSGYPSQGANPIDTMQFPTVVSG